MTKVRNYTATSVLFLLCAFAKAADPAFPDQISLPNEFLINVKPGCFLVEPYPAPSNTVSWSGQCKNGRASGYGKVSFYKDGKLVAEDERILENGFYLSALDSANYGFQRTSVTYLKSPTNSACGIQLPTYTRITQPTILSLFRIADFDCKQPKVHILVYLNDQLFAIFDGELALGVYPNRGTLTYFTGTKWKIGAFPGGTVLHSGMVQNWLDTFSIINSGRERSTGDSQITKTETEKESQRQNQLTNFRRNLSPGDGSSNGTVIEVKGNLVKVQTNESQCTQRNYNGQCTNYINTPAEKWYKRSELYPQ